MLKRLIIAVFVLGLILSFSGTAFSDVVKHHDVDGKYEPINLSHPHINQVLSRSIVPAVPSQRANMSDPLEIRDMTTVSKPVITPSGYSGEVIDNTAATWNSVYGLPGGADGIRTSLAERFTVDQGMTWTVTDAYAFSNKTLWTGSPSLVIYLYDDNGFGQPGTKLDSALVSNSCLTNTACTPVTSAGSLAEIHGHFNGSWVFNDGESFHIGVKKNGTGTLNIWGDNGAGPYAGEQTGSVYNTATSGWMSSEAWYSGSDKAFALSVEKSSSLLVYSDCYPQSYHVNASTYWKAPDPTLFDEAYAMRFSPAGPETLKSVDVYIDAVNSTPGIDLVLTVYNDAAGLPGSVVQTVTVLSGALSYFPTATNVDLSSYNLVFEDDFHVGISSNGVTGVSALAFILDDGSSSSGRGTTRIASVWSSLFTAHGIDGAFNLIVNMCKDEFAVCSNNNTHFNGHSGGDLSLPYNVYGLFHEAQQFNGPTTSFSGCKIKTVEVTLGYLTSDAARAPKMYQKNTKVSVYTNVAGTPGSSLGSITLTPADYTAAGNVGYSGTSYFWTQNLNFESLNIQVIGDYFIVLEALTGQRDSGVRVAGDGNGTGANLPAWVNATLYGGWQQIYNFFGGSSNWSLWIAAKVCCIPATEYVCTTPNDWSTPAGNYQRTSRSNVSLGDAYCDLNLRWYYEHPSQFTAFNGPITFKGRVAQVWTGTVTQFNLLTGAPIWTQITAAGILGTNMRNTPTAATIDSAGTPIDVIYTGGGGANSIACWNWDTGVLRWYRSPFSVPILSIGSMTVGTFSIATQAGTEVLYYCSGIGRVGALNANTGANYPGWGVNPISLPGAASEYMNTYNPDNNLLYVGDAPAAGSGDVFAVNAATGAIVWQLSVAGPGLRAATLHSGTAATRPEVFSAHASYEGGFLYTNSRQQAITLISHYPADGIYYKIDAATGAIVHARISSRMYRSTPVIDKDQVIVTTLSFWPPNGLAQPGGGDIVSYSKTFGTTNWWWSHPDNPGYWLPSVLTCETGAPDQLYSFGTTGFVSALNADNGHEDWSRRMDFGPFGGGAFRGFGVALSKDGELAVSHEWGGLAVLAKDNLNPRPRLEFITYNPFLPVSFGPNPALAINLGWFVKNTGCQPLNISSVTVNAASPTDQTFPGYSLKPENVGENLLSVSEKLAETMAKFGEGSKWESKSVTDASDMVLSFDKSSRHELVNRAALAAPPSWFVSQDQPSGGDVIAPGDSVELLITVNQPLISRGPNYAFLSVASDDPDFFLNDSDMVPEAKVTLVGGCLTDTTDLWFGVGYSNFQHVFNHGRLADGSWPEHGFYIDGDGAMYYQGSYIYSVSQRRFAVSSRDWSGDGNEWISMQADPNWCDASCKPAIEFGYTVPDISTDGLTYTTVAADMVCRSYIDSVQNFDLGAGWSVENWTAPFDNDSTIGLYVKSRVIGAADEAGLANATVDIMEVTERNGNAVPGWYFGSVQDYDVGSGDVAGIDVSVSTAYAFAGGQSTGIWGQIKLPFGCGQTPILNTHGMQGAQALYTPDFYFDSQYVNMTRVTPFSSQVVAGGDFEQHNTFVKRDIAPNESFSYAVAHFAFPTEPHGGSNSSAPAVVKDLSRLLNKWVGWGRGDMNNDNVINLADVVYLAGTVNFAGPGAIPFEHLGDVNASGGIDQADVDYLIAYYFSCGPCPLGDWTM